MSKATNQHLQLLDKSFQVLKTPLWTPSKGNQICIINSPHSRTWTGNPPSNGEWTWNRPSNRAIICNLKMLQWIQILVQYPSWSKPYSKPSNHRNLMVKMLLIGYSQSNNTCMQLMNKLHKNSFSNLQPHSSQDAPLLGGVIS
jgi:hypothetical protein